MMSYASAEMMQQEQGFELFNLMLMGLAAVAAGFGTPADIWASIVKDFANITEPSAFAAFVQVLMIDLVLAGDNAIVVGALAAGLPADQRKKVIFIGVIAALILRVIFALIVTQLMQIIGLILVGGLLLLWVSWRMWRDLHHQQECSPGSEEIVGDEHSGLRSAKSFTGAVWAVAVADVSMSLDNVLAVAGAARDHPGILIVGLIFAVALMGIAANFIARYIERYRWIAYLGLAVILYVAVKMIYEGWIHPEVGLGRLFV
jgi:YjbE family integral membrane protein